jgi:hypothetical protein
MPLVQQPRRVHRIPASRFVTIAIRPLCRGGMAEGCVHFGKKESEIFSRGGLDKLIPP